MKFGVIIYFTKVLYLESCKPVVFTMRIAGFMSLKMPHNKASQYVYITSPISNGKHHFEAL